MNQVPSQSKHIEQRFIQTAKIRNMVYIINIHCCFDSIVSYIIKIITQLICGRGKMCNQTRLYITQKELFQQDQQQKCFILNNIRLIIYYSRLQLALRIMEEISKTSKNNDEFTEGNVLQKGKKVCIEDICLEQTRLIEPEDKSHENHKLITWQDFLSEIEVLKCNFHFRQADNQKVTKLLQQLSGLYDQIVQFEHEIMNLFNEIRFKVSNHIKEVNQSFSQDYYIAVKTRNAKQFTYSNISQALYSAQRFRKLEYPNLDYPNFKVNLLRQKLSSISLNNKIIAIQAISTWVQRLLARDKPDRVKSVGYSMATFMLKNPLQKLLFSYYLKDPQYSVCENGQLLKRIGNKQEFPLAVVQKELLDNVEVKFKIIRLPKEIIIGFADLRQIEQNQFNRPLAKYTSGYFINNRGDCLLPLEKCKNSKLNLGGFIDGDVIWLKRIEGMVQFGRKRGEKTESFRVELSQQECQYHLYPCLILMDQDGLVLLAQ